MQKLVDGASAKLNKEVTDMRELEDLDMIDLEFVDDDED